MCGANCAQSQIFNYIIFSLFPQDIGVGVGCKTQEWGRVRVVGVGK